jgi:hypothetical protein
VVTPAAKAAAELKTVRADDVGEPGQITAQAVQHCLKAKAAVADLTEGNPNVYYELSVRHGAQLPVVLIAEIGTTLPFDISQSRVIFFDHTDLNSAGKAQEHLCDQITASLSAAPDNPISDGMRLAELVGGNAEEQTLAVMMRQVSHMATTVEDIYRRLPPADVLFPALKSVPLAPEDETNPSRVLHRLQWLREQVTLTDTEQEELKRIRELTRSIPLKHPFND